MSRLLLPLLLLAAPSAAQDQDDVQTHLAAAQERLKADDLAGALPHLDAAIEVAPKHVGALVTRGRVHSGLGSYEEAVADFDRAAEHDPDNHEIRFFRGNAKQALHDYDGAIEDFGQSFQLSGKRFFTGLLRRAGVRELKGDLDGAADDYTQLTILANRWELPYAYRGRIKAERGDAKGAEDDFAGAIYCKPDSPDTYLTRGRARLDLGDEKAAFEDLSRAVAMAPDAAGTYFVRGLAHYDVGRVEAALADVEKSIELEPDGREYARLYRYLCRMRLGRAEEGAKALRAYLAEREEKDDWFVRVASFLAGDLGEAEFLAAAETDNGHETRERRCEAYWYAAAKRLAAGDEARARDLLEKCRATGVWSFIEYDSAGHALKRLGATATEAR